ncbi:unnamed protein product [Cuscuta europaea]|uniref:5' exonuclease Apollo n=1 Tax=Cuscuta europaea TaxID=41803 RepID=A0A9P1EBK2_CUSEU|nr:unnamed protein product [Cuscuta europaea]
MDCGMISVDRWGSGSQAYFLTHLHADHTQGLSPSWRRGPLFCSRVSAKLFPSKFSGFDLSLLRVVDIGTWYPLSLVSPSSSSFSTVNFLAIDAYHCPGAVMYLFRGEFGCMLYTGDFRWEETSDRALIGREMLLNALKDVKLDYLYLDNTYCNPAYTFPSREVAAKQVLNIIASYPEHDIVIAIDSLGKENLLVYISRALKVKIWVWPERLRTMHLLGFHDIFTTKTSLTRVRAVPRYSFSIETLECLNMIRPTIGIMPSGLPWVLKTNKGKPNPFGPDRYHQYIYTVPYSDHSCYPEIQDFVKLLTPVNIEGIVTSATSYINNPLYYFGHLCGTQHTPQVVSHQQLETTRSGNSKLKRKSVIKKLQQRGGRVCRASILRRVRRGVKVLESEDSFV